MGDAGGASPAGPQRRGVALGAAAVAVLFIGLDVASAMSIPRYDAVRTVERGDARPPLSGEALAEARSRLAAAPLNAAALNAVAVGLEASGDPAANEAWALLSRLGYRSRDAQLNLLFRANQRQDLAETVRRVDILLRRGRDEDTMFSVLAAIEESDLDQGELRQALLAAPPWRDQFLRRAQGQSAAAFARRVAVIEALAAAGEVDRGVLDIAMRKAVSLQDAGGLERLLALEIKAGRAPADGTDAAPLVHQWQFAQNLDFQAFASEDGWFEVEHTGKTAAVMASRHLTPGEAGRSLGFVIEALDGGGLPEMNARLVCPHKRRELGQLAAGTTRVTLPAPFPCAVPRLELVARGEAMGSPQRFRIKLLPAAR